MLSVWKDFLLVQWRSNPARPSTPRASSSSSSSAFVGYSSRQTWTSGLQLRRYDGSCTHWRKLRDCPSLGRLELHFREDIGVRDSHLCSRMAVTCHVGKSRVPDQASCHEGHLFARQLQLGRPSVKRLSLPKPREFLFHASTPYI